MFTIIVDTNILFPLFWAESFTKDIIWKVRIIAPERAYYELKNHKKDIPSKAKISNLKFDEILEEIKNKVLFVPRKKYEEYLIHGEALNDAKDADFFALAIYLNTPLWSNDAELKKQEIVDVMSTEDMIKILSSSGIKKI